MYVGDTAAGSMAVSGGGSVSTGGTCIGYFTGSSGSTVTVTGAGSTWTTGGDALLVGRKDEGHLSVFNGGSVSSGTGYVSVASSGGGSTATVQGSNSTWEVSASLYVGGHETGAGGTAEVTVSDGGSVEVSDTLKLWSGGTVTLSGGTIETDAFDYATDSGTFSWNSGTVHFTDELTIETGAGFGDAVYVTSGRALEVNGLLHVGENATGRFYVRDGGTVSSGGSYIAYQSGSSGRASVTDAGSTWTTGSLLVGRKGQGELSILDGGSVSSGTSYVGVFPTGDGSVAVEETDSIWDVSGSLYVGGHETGPGGTAEVTVRTGGSVQIADTVKLWGDGTVNLQRSGSITTGSFHNNEGGTFNFSGGTLTIDGGTGRFHSDYVTGFALNGSFNPTLRLTNAALANIISRYPGGSRHLCVGDGAKGTLEILGGARMYNASGSVGRETGSSGEVTVSGSGSTWDNDGSLRLGHEGEGTLEVLDGGQVSSDGSYLAHQSGSSGTVSVTGAGSTWDISGSLYVGGHKTGPGGTGELTVSGGGSVQVADTLKVWGGGTVNFDGGTIRAETIDRTAGTFNWNGGTVAFTDDLTVDTGQPFGDTVVVEHTLEVADRLIIGPGGSIEVHNGTIQTRVFDRSAGSFTWSGQWNGLHFTEGLTIAPGRAFGGSFAMSGPGWQGFSRFEVAGTLTIGSGGSVTLSDFAEVGGLLNTGGTLELRGRLTVNGGVFSPVPSGSWYPGAAAKVVLLDGATCNMDGNIMLGALDMGLLYLHIDSGSSLSCHRLDTRRPMSGGLDEGITVENGGSLTVEDSLWLHSKALRIRSGGRVEVGDSITGGEIRIEGGTLIAGTITSDVLFPCRGAILTVETFVGDLALSSSIIAPGQPLGLMTVEGDLSIYSGAVEIELGGLLRGDEYDALIAAEEMCLDFGTLDVTCIDPGGGVFAPQLSDTFDILDWGTLTGTFDTVNLPSLDPGLSWDVSALYTTGEITVHRVPGEPSVLTWDGIDPGDWNSAHWHPGPVLPVDAKAMVVNSGTVVVSSDLTALPAQSLSIASDVAGGTVRVTPSGTLIVADAVTVGAAGTADVAGTLNALSVTVEEGGTLSVEGTVDAPTVTISGGTLTTAAAPGKGMVLGSLELTAEATFAVDVTNAGVDRLDCSGMVTIGPSATLDITLAGFPGPALGTEMLLIEAAGGIIGTFGEIDGVLLPGNQACAVTYEPHSVTVTIVRPGDFDVDGNVDFADFTYLAAHYGESGKTWVDGDADGNGTIDFADFTYLAANYGMDGDSSAELVVVPEPAALTIVAIGGLAILRRRRR